MTEKQEKHSVNSPSVQPNKHINKMKIQNFRLYTALLICALAGMIVGSLTASPLLGLIAGSVLVLVGMAPKEVGSLFMATPDTSALTAYVGKYQKELFAVLRNSLDIFKDITVIPGIKNTLKLTKLTVKDGVRAYREQFDAADDDLAYSGRDLSVELLKRDLLINPIKYRSTWMSEVMKPGVNPTDIPFAKFVNEQVAIKVAAEVNDGAYLAVKGAGTSVATSFNGFAKLIADAIAGEVAVAGSGLVPVVTGAITASNAVAALETMTRAMPVAYRKAGFTHNVSYDVFDKYNLDYREKYGKYLTANDDGFYYIDGTSRKVDIAPRSWMGTSQRIISTPTLNLLAGVDALGDIDTLVTDVELEIIKWRIFFAVGFQIRDLQAMKINDQA